VTAGLDEGDVDADPMRQFHAWYAEAGTDAVALVTASAGGDPAGRMVLLKGADDRGFAFYTNHGSAKAADLAARPRAALVFFWPPDRQVRVQGAVARVADDESDAYWRRRPRASQLGAWASRQSEVIDNRGPARAPAGRGDGPVPRRRPPPALLGRLPPGPRADRVLDHRDDRLHDRLRFRREGGGWVIERLSP